MLLDIVFIYHCMPISWWYYIFLYPWYIHYWYIPKWYIPFISIISRCFDHRELRQHCRAPQPYDVGLWLHRGGRRGRGQRRWGLAAQRPQRPRCFVGRFQGHFRVISWWVHDDLIGLFDDFVGFHDDLVGFKWNFSGISLGFKWYSGDEFESSGDLMLISWNLLVISSRFTQPTWSDLDTHRSHGTEMLPTIFNGDLWDFTGIEWDTTPIERSYNQLTISTW